MPTRNNTKRSDWMWVELKRAERAAQGKKTVFQFKGRVYKDVEIEKRIRRNTTLTQPIFAKQKPIPKTPTGWTATTPPTTLEQTFPSRLHEIPDDDQMTRYKSTHSPAIDTDHEHGAESNKEQFDLMGNTTTMFEHLAVSDWQESGFLESSMSPSLMHDLSDYKTIYQGPKLGHRDYYNHMLLCAARDGDVNEIRLAIKCGADPSHSQKHELSHLGTSHIYTQWTPLHYAAFNGHPEAVRVLIKERAEINKRCSQGETPLDLTYRSLLQWPLISSEIELSKLHTRIILKINGAKTTRTDTTGQRILDETVSGEGTTRVDQLAFDALDFYYPNCRLEVIQHILDKERDRKDANTAIKCVPDERGKGKGEAEAISPSPMSWQYTALVAPEALKGSPFKLSRFLGCSTRSAAISIDGSSYRPSAPEQASLSLKAILLKNSQGSHKLWATPPMRTPPL